MNRAGLRGRRRATWIAALLLGVLSVDAAAMSAAVAAEGSVADTLQTRSENLEDVVDGLDLPESKDATTLTAEAWQPPADEDETELPAELPSAGEATVTLGESTTEGASRTVGGLPLTLATPSDAVAPQAVNVRVAGQAEAEAAGVTGVLLELSDVSEVPASGSAVQVSVSYADFAGLVGGDWASRLQLVQLPACAEKTPAAPECRPVPVEGTVNDAAAETVTATVDLQKATATSATSATSATTIAVTAAASGSAGDWGATSLASAASWKTSGGTGAFTWSYPMRVPGVPGGLTPSLSIGYSSAAADGRVASTNNQASWIGDGFDLASSYVERKYLPCVEDRDKVDDKAANNAELYTGDLCWGADNATLALNGSAVELVKDKSTGQWRPKDDDGVRIEHKTGGWSSDDDGEYWVVTTVDGTVYSFGRDKRSSDDASRQSAWTVPVFGNHPGEPCYETTFKASRCQQAWRWNLEYVVDTSGNTMTYTYQRDAAAYRVGEGSSVAGYNPGGHLSRVEYGTRSGADVGAKAPALVDFGVATRCEPRSGVDCDKEKMLDNKSAWPDVPTDLYCEPGSETCEKQVSPVFFDRYRLAKITTRAYDGSAYQPVDSWALAQAYLNPNDGGGSGGTGKILWLKSITHTGHGGTASTSDDKALPPALFVKTYLRNRVDSVTDGPPPMWRPRLSSIRTESGGLISVAYRKADCLASELPTNPKTNAKLCFPVDWDPDGFTKEKKDWFHKYVVDTIVANGAGTSSDGRTLVTGSGQVTTRYTYSGGAVWKKPTGPLVKPKEVTYSDFRGFAGVTTTVGDDAEATTSTTSYFRGTGEQLTAGPSGHTLDVEDAEPLAGQTFSSVQKNGSKNLVQTVSIPADLVTTATGADGTQATRIGKRVSMGFAFRQDGEVEQRTRSVTSLDDHGQVVTVDDAGSLAVAGDELCTRLTYAHDSDAAFAQAHLVNRVARAEVVDVACAASTTRPADVQSDTLTSYDSKGRGLQTWEVAPGLDRAKGVLTPSTRAGYLKTGEVTGYDQWGRATGAKDALGRQTTTSYTQSAGGLTARIGVTSPDPDGSGSLSGFTSTTDHNALTGTVARTTDPNGKATTGSYDGLGRVLEVRYPDRQGATIPSVAYSYLVQENGLNSVMTRTVGADGTSQHAQSVMYDGLMRPFQTQVESTDAGVTHDDTAAARGRVVSHTFYDTAGRTAKQTGQWWAKGAPTGAPVVAPPVTPSFTTFVYDGAGRVTDEILWNGTDSNPDYEQWRSVTDYDGAYTTVVPPSGGTATTTVMDARGRKTAVWEHLARPSVSKGSAGSSSALAGFDPRTEPASGHQVTSYTYDGSGRLELVRDPKKNAWTFGYDFAGRQLSATDPDSGTTSRTYDAVGQLKTVTNAENQTLTYTYDGLGRSTSVTEGTNTRVRWAYDTAKDVAGKTVLGQLASSTRYAAEGEYTTSVGAYDHAYRPLSTTVTVPATGAFTPLGSRSFTTSVAYMADGQLRSTTMPQVQSSTGVVLLGKETVTTQYDTASQPRWMGGGFGWGTYVAESRYTAYGQPLLMDLGNSYGAAVSYRFDEVTHRLANVALKREQIDGTDLAVSYRYDDAGNVLSVKDRPTNSALAGAAFGDNQCFRYDGLRRLSLAWTAADPEKCGQAAGEIQPGDVGGVAPYWTQYAYDALGNRSSVTQHATDGTAGTTKTLYTYAATDSGSVSGPHALTSTSVSVDGAAATSAASFAYDKSGNQTLRDLPATDADFGEQTFGWDAEGELTRIDTPEADDTGDAGSAADGDAASLSAGEARFTYDAGGQRLVRVDAGGTTLYLPGGQEVHVSTDGDVSAVRYYGFAGQLVAMRTGAGLGKVTSLVSDHHGTPLAAVPNTTWTATSVTKEYTDPFGGVRGSATHGIPGDRQFLGKTRDQHTGLTLLDARYYDELTGRFLSVDPLLMPGVPDTLNAYAYASNNPLTNSDPSGLCSDPHACDWYDDHPDYNENTGTGPTPGEQQGGSSDTTGGTTTTTTTTSGTTTSGSGGGSSGSLKAAMCGSNWFGWMCKTADATSTVTHLDDPFGQCGIANTHRGQVCVDEGAEILYKVSGAADLSDCTHGSMPGCAFTVVNLIPGGSGTHAAAGAGVIALRASRVGRVADSGDELVDVFRVVGPNEAADIAKTGAYRVQPGGEGKYFFGTQKQAENLGQMYNKSPSFPGPQTVTRGQVPRSVLSRAEQVNAGTEGPGWFIRTPDISSICNVSCIGTVP